MVEECDGAAVGGCGAVEVGQGELAQVGLGAVGFELLDALRPAVQNLGF